MSCRIKIRRIRRAECVDSLTGRRAWERRRIGMWCGRHCRDRFLILGRWLLFPGVQGSEGGGGGGCRTPVSPGGGGIGRQPDAEPQHCCSALTWAPVPRIYCDLLVLTNRVRIADKAGALCSPGQPGATLPQRGRPGRLGPSWSQPSWRGRQGLLGHFSTTRVLRTFLSSVSAFCFPGWMLLTAQMVPVAFVAVGWT